MPIETPAAPAAETTSAASAPSVTTPSANEFSSFLGVEPESLPPSNPSSTPNQRNPQPQSQSQRPRAKERQ